MLSDMATKYTRSGKFSVDGGPWQERSETVTASKPTTPRRAAFAFKEGIAIAFTQKDTSRVKVKQFKMTVLDG